MKALAVIAFLFGFLGFFPNDAYAALLNCKDRSGKQMEHFRLLEVRHTRHCSSGISGTTNGWKFQYCVSNHSGKFIRPGIYQACGQFQGPGKGRGILHVFQAVDARWR